MYDIIKRVRCFLLALYICIILLKVVTVCFGVVLCSEVDNVVLHALPTPFGSLSPDVLESRLSLRSLVSP